MPPGLVERERGPADTGQTVFLLLEATRCALCVAVLGN